MAVALLLIERDEVIETLSKIRSIGHTFGEIVVVDSSGTEGFRQLLDKKPREVKAFHAPPLGYADVFIPYGLSKIESDYVLLLGTDEFPSARLEKEVQTLDKYDGYWIPRIEHPSQRVSFHMRLFRKDSFVVDGYIHGNTRVNGTECRLPLSMCIAHHIEEHHLRRRQRRYLEIELFEHPEPGGLGRILSRRFARPLPSVLIPMYILRDLRLEFEGIVRGILAYGVIEWFRYITEKYVHVYTQPKARQELAVSISREMRRAGGPIKYLGLDNPMLVESLDGYAKRRNLIGVNLFIDLLISRYTNGSMDQIFRTGAGSSREAEL